MLRRLTLTLLLIIIGGVLALSCTTEQGGENREEAVANREQVFDRATSLYPDPRPENFPARQALIEFTARQDLLNHPWFVYILGNNGNVIGYYVAQTRPINSCNFLSSTEKVRDDDDGNVVLTAPSLDGIFYGGGGASAGCDAWFFFDSATDAMIEIRGVNFFTSDQPLLLEAEAITVDASP